MSEDKVMKSLNKILDEAPVGKISDVILDKLEEQLKKIKPMELGMNLQVTLEKVYYIVTVYGRYIYVNLSENDSSDYNEDSGQFFEDCIKEDKFIEVHCIQEILLSRMMLENHNRHNLDIEKLKQMVRLIDEAMEEKPPDRSIKELFDFIADECSIDEVRVYKHRDAIVCDLCLKGEYK